MCWSISVPVEPVLDQWQFYLNGYRCMSHSYQMSSTLHMLPMQANQGILRMSKMMLAGINTSLS